MCTHKYADNLKEQISLNSEINEKCAIPDIVGSLQENVVSTFFLRQVFNPSEVDGALQVNGVSMSIGWVF